jgi:RNA polymerase sigma factor (sigma-70 family)
MTRTDLYAKHASLAASTARKWYVPGHDRDDVIQEARIALWEAAGCYDPTVGTPFRGFAIFVINRRLRDFLRRATRPAQMVLTDSARDVEETATTAADIAHHRAELRAVVAAYKNLSPLERKAVSAAANGTPYRDVGPFRSIDNAVQRGRRHLREAVAS